jgi:hypothetical protein
MVMPSNKQASENTSSRQTINNESTETAENSDKLSDKPWYELTKDIIIPVAVFILGAFFTWSQFKITSDKQKSDDTAKDTETKEQVLTDYGKTIAELVTKNKLDKEGDNSVKNIARGQTLIALRRLNVADKNGKADESKDEAGKLKGLLIRYLYDARLILYPSDDVLPQIDLSGANINKIVLQDAWLPNIGLQKAWLNEGNFKKANLKGAKFYQASLINADFTGADLGGADFTGADLRGADLRGADLNNTKLDYICYVEETSHFPPDFKLKDGMYNMSKDTSDPSKSDFEPCPTVFKSTTPP